MGKKDCPPPKNDPCDPCGKKNETNSRKTPDVCNKLGQQKLPPCSPPKPTLSDSKAAFIDNALKKLKPIMDKAQAAASKAAEDAYKAALKAAADAPKTALKLVSDLRKMVETGSLPSSGSGSSRAMKFPYTMSAKFAQFPIMFYVKNQWIWKHYAAAFVICIPVFYKISKLSNTPNNKAVWAEIRRKQAQEANSPGNVAQWAEIRRKEAAEHH